MKRKTFIKYVSVGTAATLFYGVLPSCQPPTPPKRIFFRSGAIAAVGHRVKNQQENLPSAPLAYQTDCVIIGGGISGLTAAYHLNNKKDFILLELDAIVGGNSKSGKNIHSAYPYGAHYLPIPNLENKELIGFLHAHDIVTKISPDGLPTYNEIALCHDPEERLLVNNHWQEGLIPELNTTPEDKAQIKRFFETIETLRYTLGDDRKFVFNIPLAEASSKSEHLALDKISFKEYLDKEGYSSTKLLWYLDYCCRDDYGQGLEKISAYAGIHYFAARRGKGANCEDNHVLTWAEGNGHLTNLLAKDISDRIKTNCLVEQIKITKDVCLVDVWNSTTNKRFGIKAATAIMAVPHFVAQRILKESNRPNPKLPSSQPWLVANITASKINEWRGYPLSWDNVAVNSKSLGVVYAGHQSLAISKDAFVFTLYKALDYADAKTVRQEYYRKTDEDLYTEIVADFEKIFPDSAQYITEIDFHLHGHGMISPGIGYLTNLQREQLYKPISNKVFFAHTDYSGISIFEEAFWHGQRAANEVLKTLNHETLDS